MLWGIILLRMKKIFIKNKSLDHFLVLGSTEIELLLVDYTVLFNKKKVRKKRC